MADMVILKPELSSLEQTAEAAFLFESLVNGDKQ